MAGFQVSTYGRFWVSTEGEHRNSFYVWQGFMEGALLSGIDAATAILRDIKGTLG